MVSRRNFVTFALTTTLAKFGPQQIYSQGSTPSLVEPLFDNLFESNLPNFPEAAAGKVDIILVSRDIDGSVAVVVHNASDNIVGMGDFSGIARNEDGSLVAVSEHSSIAPYILRPGEYGLSTIDFDKDFPNNAEITFEMNIDLPGELTTYRLDIPVVDASIERKSVIGVASNNTKDKTSDTMVVLGVFFTPGGKICGWFKTLLNNSVSPGGTGTFSGTVMGETSTSYAIAASGWS